MAPIISSVESTIVYAADAAKFISDQSSTIVPRLEEGLAQLGYRGKYAVRCGFNEEFLEEGLHPEVFLFLYTELKCDEAAISKVISPIFSPHTTIMYTPFQFHYLDPPTKASDGCDLPGSQESSPSSVPNHQLASASDPSRDSQPQPSDHAGEDTSQGQGSRQEFNSGSSDKNHNRHPEKEEDDATSKQQPDNRGNAEQNEEEPENDSRQLEFELQAFLRMKDQDGLGSDVLISQIETMIRVEINGNPDGNNPPDLESPRIIIDPWTFIEFCNLDISNSQTRRYALSSIEAQIVTTPFEADCLQQHPAIPGPTGCHKVPAEYRGGRKRSLALGLDIDDWAIMRRESELQHWDPTSNSWVDPIRNILLVQVGYLSNRPGRMTDKPSFKSTLHAFLSSPTQPGTDRILNIEIKAFWKSTERPDKKSVFSSRLGVRPNELVNFYHKIFFKINLEEIMRGKVTKWLSYPTPKEDFIQRRRGSDEAALGRVDIEFLPAGKQTTFETSSRPDHRLVMTLHRTVEVVKD